MDKKYMFFDLDGTLTTGVKYGNEIPQLTLETIQALKDAGHFLCLATGRPYFHAKEMAEKTGIDHMICNGGYTASLAGERIFHQGMDQKEVGHLIAECEANHVPYAISVAGDDAFVTNSLELKKTADDFNFWGKITINPYFTGTAYESITRMLVDESYLDHNDGVTYENIILMRYYAPFMIVEPDDKIGGIHQLMDYLKAPKEDVVCFGDGSNDMSMIQGAAIGIAMGNAIDQLKAVADYVTTDSDKDGILHACKHFGWL
ncbi:hypothetical protein A4S06_03510 [Erysipelotrichaceae bacterium MTC7]|nr:hypothetical protein A4S06_03510 [Erysipelotrichaceae bacterium MTC7]